jgi:tetratricopeptide (TPR) repeat protein
LPELGSRLISGLLAVGALEEASATVEELRRVNPKHPLILLQSVAVVCALLSSADNTMTGSERKKSMNRARRDLDNIAKSSRTVLGTPVDSRVRELYPLRYRGELALLEGKVTEAVGLYERALSLDPKYSCGWLGLAECSRFAGDDKRALKLYLRTVTENEGNHRAWLRGRDLMMQMNFQDNAASWWRKVVDNFPEHPAVLTEGRSGGCGSATEASDAVPVTT